MTQVMVLLPSAAPARMIVPGFADHDPGPGIEGMGRGALPGAGRARRAVTRGHARPRAGFHKASWRTVSWVRVTGWHASDRTRVLPRLNGQAEPRAVLARAPRDLPCSPREHAALVNEGLFRNSAIGGADAAHPRNIRTAAEVSAPRARLAPGRLRCLGHGCRPSPARPRPSPGGAGYLARHAARGVPPRGTGVKAARPPRPPPMPPAGPRRKCSASRPAQPHSCRA